MEQVVGTSTTFTSTPRQTAYVPEHKWSYILNTLQSIHTDVQDIKQELAVLKDRVLDTNLKIDDLRPTKLTVETQAVIRSSTMEGLNAVLSHDGIVSLLNLFLSNNVLSDKKINECLINFILNRTHFL